MAIARVEVQTAVSDGADPGVSQVTLGTPSTAGELIVAVFYCNGDGPGGSVTDSASQTYTKLLETTGIGSHHAIALYYKANSASGVTWVKGTDTSGDVRGGIIVGHYTGIATSPADVDGGNPASGGTSPWTSTTCTTTQANELLVGLVFAQEDTGTCDIAASGSWTQQAKIVSSAAFDNGNGNAIAYADQIVSSIQTNIANTGTIPTGTVTASYCSLATFKAAGSAGDVTITGVRALVSADGVPGSVSITGEAGSYIEPESDVPCLVCATTYSESFVASGYSVPAGSSLVPTAVIRIDVTNDPTNPARVWTDITDYVRQISLTRDGRSNETERTQTGSCSLLVDNRDGRFNRDNADGPYYPRFKTTCWLQVRGVWDGVTYDRWTGVIEQVSQSWPSDGADAVAQISAASPLKILNLAPLDGNSFGTQYSGARVADVVGIAQLTAGTIDAGAAPLPAYSPAVGDGAKALSHLQAVEAEEPGIVFTDASGSLQFHDRHHRMRMSSGTAVTIPSGATVASTGTAQSPSGDYYMIMQSDGSFAEYTSAGAPVWATNTAGGGTNSGASVVMQGNGDLVVYHAGTATWASNTSGHTGAYLSLLDNGDWRILSATGTAVLYNVSGVTAVIGDQGQQIPYTDIQLDDDDQFLFNHVVFTPAVGGNGVYDEVTSQDAHFVRGYQQSMLAAASGQNEAQAHADAFIMRYKEPALRINSVRILGANIVQGFQTANWPIILSAKNSDPFTVVRQYPDAGTVSIRVFLERVSEQISPGNRWDTTWLLSPGTVDSYMANRFWRVGNPIYGKVGSFAVGY